ncbi:MAG TPA: hypothetical protein VHT03_05940 [Rhizomicrobium sp.]|jgi:hypothetical protein|nr:hypothetical protein [Rhizomicrobium sp.]
MEVHHKRNVFQGWREFLKEVGIIVLGVLIALGAEQAAVAVQEAGKASRSEALVRDEFALNVAFAQERLAATPCILSRLDELRRVLLKTSDRTTLPDLGEIGTIPARPFEWGAWEAMVSAGLVDHLADQRRWSYQHIYLNGDANDAYQQEEQRDWATLYSLSGASRLIDTRTREQMLQVIEQARNIARFMKVVAQHMVDFARPLNLPAARTGHRMDLRSITQHSICKKLTGAG